MINNSRLLWRSSLIIFLFFSLISFVSLWGWSFVKNYDEHVWIFVVFGGLFALFLAYVVTSFILDPIFKTNFLLDTLLKNTLHELNIPLATIQANTQLLKNEASESSKKRITRIEKASKNLSRLYEEIDYYIKREISLVEEEVFELGEVVEDLLEQVSYMDGSIKASIAIKRYQIKTDKIGFQKTILNLLSNAYKYNRKNGTILVRLDGHKLSVEDSGVGMSEETKFHLFDRYYQQNNESKGHGIGLSIVKDFCDTYGIFISIASKEGVGTSVSLNLKSLHVKI